MVNNWIVAIVESKVNVLCYRRNEELQSETEIAWSVWSKWINYDKAVDDECDNV